MVTSVLEGPGYPEWYTYFPVKENKQTKKNKNLVFILIYVFRREKDPRKWWTGLKVSCAVSMAHRYFFYSSLLREKNCKLQNLIMASGIQKIWLCYYSATGLFVYLPTIYLFLCFFCDKHYQEHITRLPWK